MRGGTAEPTSRDQHIRQKRDREKWMLKKVTERRKPLTRKRRRRGRADRRHLRQSETRNRARARGQEIIVATHNVRTMAMDGTHKVGRVVDVLSVYDRLGCDVIDLEERTCSLHPGCLLGVLYCTVLYCTVLYAVVSAVARVMVGRKGKTE